MPRKNSLKIYVEGGYYHVYNRGVEKRIIFEDDQDYKTFLSYLKYSLSDPPKPEKVIKTFTLQGLPFKGIPRLPKNFKGKIQLLTYCLMPNHFHFLVKQTDKDSLKNFMLSLITRYSMYFNKKYDRVGSLFQGVYKAVIISDESYLIHLSRYIHLNPSEYSKDLVSGYSSYADYLRLRKTSWLSPEVILDLFEKPVELEFKKVESYKKFVENYEEKNKSSLGNLAID